MWGVCLDVDFKCDFVVIDEAPLWVGNVLKQNASERRVNEAVQHNQGPDSLAQVETHFKRFES